MNKPKSSSNVILKSLIAVSVTLLLLTACKASLSSSLPNQPSYLPNDPPYFHNSENDKLIVFIHGLTGDSRNTWTWTKSDPPFFWPERVFNDPDYKGYDVLSFGFTSGCGAAYNIPQLAQSLETALTEVFRKKNYESVSFVAHSLGGLVTRKFILDDDGQTSIESVVLLGTPNFGNDLAKIGDLFCKNPQWEDLVNLRI